MGIDRSVTESVRVTTRGNDWDFGRSSSGGCVKDGAGWDRCGRLSGQPGCGLVVVSGGIARRKDANGELLVVVLSNSMHVMAGAGRVITSPRVGQVDLGYSQAIEPVETKMCMHGMVDLVFRGQLILGFCPDAVRVGCLPGVANGAQTSCSGASSATVDNYHSGQL